MQESVQLEAAQQSLSEQLAAKEAASSHGLLVAALEEAESLIKRVLIQLDDPSPSGNTCTPEHLMSCIKACLDTIDNTAAAFSLYTKDPQGVPTKGLVQTVC